MTRDQENHIGYEKWAELMSKNTFLYEEEKSKSLSKLYDMFDDDFEDEVFSGSKSKKVKV